MSLYTKCLLCPRRCGVDREAGQTGFCGETSALRLAFAGIHYGEEPPVTGKGGSGAIFVSGCNLGCAFCQNYQISKPAKNNIPLGKTVNNDEFSEICMILQAHGAENINIITGSHAAPALALGIKEARKRGLSIPVLWNSSGYEGEETLEVLKDFVNVYLPDLKTLDKDISAMFFNAPDYPEHAARAILKMMEHTDLFLRPGRDTPRHLPLQPAITNVVQEVIISGVIIRHLVIPGFLENSRQVFSWFKENCSGNALLSVMTQYTPVSDEKQIPLRYVSEEEYEAVLNMLEEYKIDDGFCQELLTGSDWLPDFNRPNPFSSDLSMPVWHFLSPAISRKQDKP